MLGVLVCVGLVVLWTGVIVILPWSQCRFNPVVKIRKFVRKTSGGQNPIWDKDIDPRRVNVYYLDQGAVKSAPIGCFLARKWSAVLGVKPQIFLVQGITKQEAWRGTANIWHAIGYSDADLRWKVSTLSGSSITLVDRFGMSTRVAEGPEMIRETLRVITTYSSVYHLLFEQVSEQCVPLLDETKKSLGRSPVIEIVREVLQDGKSLIDRSHILDIAGMLERRQQYQKIA